MIEFKPQKFIIAIIIVLVFTLMPFNLYATSLDNAETVIKLTIGSSNIKVDGVLLKAEKSYRIGKTTYIPLRAVFEALGAEVQWLGLGKLNISFRNVSVDLTVGKNKILLNQVEKVLAASPLVKNGTVMIPIELAGMCFGNDITIMVKNKEIEIALKSDGALSDLSFLTGSISKLRVGNSYFGWSIDIPKGSRVSYQSFNSKSIQIDNEHRGFGLDISVDLKESRMLDDYYKEITDNPETIINGELIDSSMNTNAVPKYIDLLYTDEYDEAVYQRIFEGDKYFYNVLVISFNESNPEVLSKDTYIKSVFTSFKLGYKGGLEDTVELSKVQFGLAQYSNYIVSETGAKKYSSWQMAILPEWDILEMEAETPYKTEFGTSIKEYIGIEVSSAKDQSDVTIYGKDIEKFYSSNFNPKLFKLIKSDIITTAGMTSYHLLYDVTIGSKQYRYDERFIITEGLVYDISFKSSVEGFENKIEQYSKMLDTFKPVVKDADELITDMEKYAYDTEKKRVGKNDEPVKYENNKYGWTMELPGYWLKNSAQAQSMESFYNSRNSAVVLLEAVDKKLVDADISDDKKFGSFKIVVAMGLEPVSIENVNVNGTSAKKYKYRIEDEENNNFADIWYYTLESEAFYYCFMSSIPDLTATSGNIAIIDDIRNSIKLTVENDKE